MSDNWAKGKIDKDNFIEFLAKATPEDLNQLILQQGKPPKLWTPIYVFKYPKEENGGKKDVR